MFNNRYALKLFYIKTVNRVFLSFSLLWDFLWALLLINLFNLSSSFSFSTSLHFTFLVASEPSLLVENVGCQLSFSLFPDASSSSSTHVHCFYFALVQCLPFIKYDVFYCPSFSLRVCTLNYSCSLTMSYSALREDFLSIVGFHCRFST